MVIPIIILVAIPIFLGIVAVSPFDQPEEFNEEIILEEPEFNDEISSELGVNVLYFLLIVIWTIILMRMLLQIKKGTFKATKRY
jgi:NADH:ubiquinone oxidoreductase subunit 5 (subunit L)/multisubunit Na+/H+ antiporter MnhA subunit